MISPRNVLVVFAALFVATAALAVFADDSDAVSIGSPTATGFNDNNSTGTLTVTASNDEANPTTFTLIVTDGSKQVASTEIKVDGNSTGKAEMKFQLGSGSHTLTVSGTYAVEEGASGDLDAVSVTVSVGQSIWSGWVPYVALIIVGAIIVLVIYLWNRGRPKSKPTVSFNDLEDGKVAAPAAATEKKKYEGTPKKDDEPSTGRVKYVSSRRK